jgi:hypothetical protein
MARTLLQWRAAILAWHTTGHTNGPIEGLNSLTVLPHEVLQLRLTEVDGLVGDLAGLHDQRDRRLVGHVGEHGGRAVDGHRGVQQTTLRSHRLVPSDRHRNPLPSEHPPMTIAGGGKAAGAERRMSGAGSDWTRRSCYQLSVVSARR